MRKLLVLALSVVCAQMYGSGVGYQLGPYNYFDSDHGSYCSQRIGSIDFVSGPNGYSGSGMQLGSYYFYND